MRGRPPTHPHPTQHECMAFVGNTCIAFGPLTEVASKAKVLIDRDKTAVVLVLDAVTGEPVEVDLRGTPEEVATRLLTAWVPPAPPSEAAPQPTATLPAVQGAPGRAPGRPRLGVVAREVTLLPRHWEWLSEQPGGASVTLRKLVETARRSDSGPQDKRRGQEACYRFMNTLAGDEPGFEEALRALYAGDRKRFEAMTRDWPEDLRFHAHRLAEGVF